VVRSGRFLLCKRAASKHHGGLWEFPGGKVQDGEAPDAALARELAEELGAIAKSSCRVLAEHLDSSSGFLISFVQAEIYNEPECKEHEQIGWYTPSEILELALAPADEMFARGFFGTG